MSFKLKGIVKFIHLESGFWGILDEKKGEWLPVNLPDQFKVEGCKIEVKAKEYDGFTIHMWGNPIEILTIKVIKE